MNIILGWHRGDAAEAADLLRLIAQLADAAPNPESPRFAFHLFPAPCASLPDTSALARHFTVWSYRVPGPLPAGWPAGPNAQLAAEILAVKHWIDSFSDVPWLLIEPDCCPTTPDWLTRLESAWHPSCSAMGCVMNPATNPDCASPPHVNGNCMVRPDALWAIREVAATDPRPWDVAAWDRLNEIDPVLHTRAILNLWKSPTIDPAALWSWVNATSAALVHGVRDSSAREAVRRRFKLS